MPRKRVAVLVALRTKCRKSTRRFRLHCVKEPEIRIPNDLNRDALIQRPEKLLRDHVRLVNDLSIRKANRQRVPTWTSPYRCLYVNRKNTIAVF